MFFALHLEKSYSDALLPHFVSCYLSNAWFSKAVEASCHVTHSQLVSPASIPILDRSGREIWPWPYLKLEKQWRLFFFFSFFFFILLQFPTRSGREQLKVKKIEFDVIRNRAGRSDFSNWKKVTVAGHFSQR